MARYDVELNEVEEMAQRLTEAGKNAETVINEVLHTEGGPLIESGINPLIPSSGRRWRGKKKAARESRKKFIQEDAFNSRNSNLAVTIRTTKNYHYLYFPDDGTNTQHHVGYRGIPREFMRKGAENKTQEIIDACVGSLIHELEG